MPDLLDRAAERTDLPHRGGFSSAGRFARRVLPILSFVIRFVCGQ